MAAELAKMIPQKLVQQRAKKEQHVRPRQQVDQSADMECAEQACDDSEEGWSPAWESERDVSDTDGDDEDWPGQLSNGKISVSVLLSHALPALVWWS